MLGLVVESWILILLLYSGLLGGLWVIKGLKVQWFASLGAVGLEFERFLK